MDTTKTVSDSRTSAPSVAVVSAASGSESQPGTALRAAADGAFRQACEVGCTPEGEPCFCSEFYSESVRYIAEFMFYEGVEHATRAESSAHTPGPWMSTMELATREVDRLQALHLERTKLTERVINERDELAAALRQVQGLTDDPTITRVIRAALGLNASESTRTTATPGEQTT